MGDIKMIVIIIIEIGKLCQWYTKSKNHTLDPTIDAVSLMLVILQMIICLIQPTMIPTHEPTFEVCFILYLYYK